MAYRFIQQYGHKYGVRWLLKRLNILPNAYYNFLKNRKSEYHKRKKKIKHEIVDIYHSHNVTDGSKRYNCTIIDLHDRSVIASITDKHITADLAKKTLQKAIDSQPGLNTNHLILHSDQGSQFTSKLFTEYCESVGITQSMSKAVYPYDTAPMERYYNTLKNELINHHYYHSEKELYTSIEEFAYVHYNHECPHSYNNYKTPFEARYGA